MRRRVDSLTWFSALAGMLVIGAMVGCGQRKTDPRLVGTWGTFEVKKGLKGEGAKYEFMLDGTFTITSGKPPLETVVHSNWWVLRPHKDGGILVRFQKEGQKPTDRVIEFIDGRIDLRDKDGSFVATWYPFKAFSNEAPADDAPADDAPADDAPADDAPADDTPADDAPADDAPADDAAAEER